MSVRKQALFFLLGVLVCSTLLWVARSVWASASTADTFIRSEAPTIDHGTSTTVQFGKSASTEWQAAFRFDTGSLVAAGAQIELAVSSEEMEASDQWRVHVRRIPEASAWTEGNGNGVSNGCTASELCWATVPASLDHGDAVDIFQPAIGSTLVIPATLALAASKAAGETTLSVLLAVERLAGDDGIDQVGFRSKEYGDATKHPKLVNATLGATATPTPAPSATPVTTATATPLATATATATPTPTTTPVPGPNPYITTSTGDPAHEATITWKADMTPELLRLGIAPSDYSQGFTSLVYSYPNTIAGGTVCCLHTVLLTGLAPGTRYYYAVGGRELSFRTAPLKGSRSPLVLAAVADTGRGANLVTKYVAESIALDDPGAVLLAGDLWYCDQPVGCEEEWFAYGNRGMGPMVGSRFVMPAPGNHEYDEPDQLVTYTARYNLPGAPIGTVCTVVQVYDGPGCPKAEVPERWYSFNYGNVHIVSLDLGPDHRAWFNGDPDEIKPGHPAYDWLAADLAAAASDPDIDWTVVYGHYTFYQRGYDDDHSSDDEARARLEDLFSTYGVDLAIGAHQHGYTRTLPVKDNGGAIVTCGPAPATACHNPGATVYLTVGTGGNSLYSDASFCGGALVGCDAWTASNVLLQYGHARIQVAGTSMTISFVGVDRAIYDQFTLSK